MTQSFDLKLYQEMREYLQKANSSISNQAPPKQGAFALFSFPATPKNSFDLVYERIYLGDASIVRNFDILKSLGVTHIVNASQGKKMNQTNTDAAYYKGDNIAFYGIPALDILTYKILPYLRPAASFMRDALLSNGTVYVHCQQGVSRSATVTIAYLMLYEHMRLMEAVQTVREKREIFPNDGFLKQLCILDRELHSS